MTSARQAGVCRPFLSLEVFWKTCQSAEETELVQVPGGPCLDWSGTKDPSLTGKEAHPHLHKEFLNPYNQPMSVWTFWESTCLSFSFPVAESPREVLRSADSKVKTVMGATEKVVVHAQTSLLCLCTRITVQGVSHSAQDSVENKTSEWATTPPLFNWWHLLAWLQEVLHLTTWF